MLKWNNESFWSECLEVTSLTADCRFTGVSVSDSVSVSVSVSACAAAGAAVWPFICCCCCCCAVNECFCCEWIAVKVLPGFHLGCWHGSKLIEKACQAMEHECLAVSSACIRQACMHMSTNLDLFKPLSVAMMVMKACSHSQNERPSLQAVCTHQPYTTDINNSSNSSSSMKFQCSRLKTGEEQV